MGLVEGLGFAPNTTNLAVETGAGHSWAQGTAIYHVNYYPYTILLGKSAEDYEKAMKHDKEKAEKKIRKHIEKLKKESKDEHHDKDKMKHERKKLEDTVKKEKEEAKKLEKLAHHLGCPTE